MKKRIIAIFLLLAMVFVACSEESQGAIDDQIAESEESIGESSATDSSDVSVPEESSDVSDTSDTSDTSDVSDTSDIMDNSDVSGGETEVPDEEEPLPMNLNLLTGLEDLTDGAVGKRPVAVMVNNVAASMPQYGISEADIIFEMPVEGMQTRLMCIYGDYTQIPEICSVRSCRKYFPIMAESFDAIYVNHGQNFSIDDYIESLELTQYDGRFCGSNLFARDQSRLDAGYGTEHTMYFKGYNFPAQLEKDGARTDLEEGMQGTAFKFNPAGEQIAPNGESCTDVYIDFGTNESGFVYNAETKTYLKTYYNTKTKQLEKHRDGNTGLQLEFTNIFVLHNEVAYDPTAVYDDKGSMHRLVDWEGGTDSVGYYISNGVKQQIYWIKEGVHEKLRFFDLDGNEISVNRGKSYICFNDIDDVDFD